jgi:hypothetical protein
VNLSGRVMVTGSLQPGRTTLVRTQLSSTGTIRSLDDQGAPNAAVADPVGLAARG